MSYKFVLHFIFSFILSVSIHARFMQQEDCPIEHEIANIEYIVEKDGSFRQIQESLIVIKNENGREWAATDYIMYSPAYSKAKILEAYTLDPSGKKIHIAKNMIEDKPYGSNLQGFDDMHRILFSYPNVVVGSKLYLKYQFNSAPQVKGFFSCRHIVGLNGSYVKNLRVKIRSKLPLHIISNDPNDALKISQKMEGQNYIIESNLTKPVCASLTNEENTILHLRKMTYIQVSTLQRHEDLIKEFLDGYEKIATQSLSEQYIKIIEEAKKIQDEVTQINYVTSELNNIVRYMGDWRTIKGAFFPRPLKTIVDTGFGDCKDFAISTVAILRQLGYEASPAMIFRGLISEDSTSLPSLFMNNHAILRAKSKTGKVYFIDPTNFASMAGLIFPDIADRLTYVLDVKNPRVEMTPAILPSQNQTEVSSDIELTGGCKNLAGSMKLHGIRALSMTGLHLSLSKQIVEENVLNDIIGKQDVIEKRLEIPDLTSRIVNDIVIKGHVRVPNTECLTNLGFAVSHSLNHDALYLLTHVSNDLEGDLWLGIPAIVKNIKRVKNANQSNLKKFNLNLENPYISLRRDLKPLKNNIVEIVERIEIKRSLVPNEYMKTQEFVAFKKNLSKSINFGLIVSE